jgi:hypothetical protein
MGGRHKVGAFSSGGEQGPRAWRKPHTYSLLLL